MPGGSNMSGVPQADERNTRGRCFLDRYLHRKMTADLSQPGITIDDSPRRSFAFDTRLRFGRISSALKFLQITGQQFRPMSKHT